MHWRWYIVITFIIAVLAGLFFVSPFLQNLFFIVAKDASTYASAHSSRTMIFFVLLAAISTMISPFSSVPIVPIGVSLWGWEIAAALLLSGWIIGGIISYAIGFFAGHPLLRQFVNEEKARTYEVRLSARMTFPRALLVRLALPAEVGYAFGLMRYDFFKYMAVTLIAEVPFAIITVHAAEALLALDVLRFAGWVFLLVLLVGISYLVFRSGKSRVS